MIQNQEAIDLMKTVDNFANDILSDVNSKNFYLGNALSSIPKSNNNGFDFEKTINELKKVKNNKSKVSSIIDKLKKEQDRIKRDNITLEIEINRINEIVQLLKDKYSEGEKLKEVIKENRAKGLSAEESIFYDENIEGPLERKMFELKQMLTVKGQSLISIEMVQKNNKVMIQNIDNIKNII